MDHTASVDLTEVCVDHGSLLLKILRGHFFKDIVPSVEEARTDTFLFHLPLCVEFTLPWSCSTVERRQGSKAQGSASCHSHVATETKPPSLANAHTLGAASGSSSLLPLEAFLFSSGLTVFPFYQANHISNISFQTYFILYFTFFCVKIILLCSVLKYNCSWFFTPSTILLF